MTNPYVIIGLIVVWLASCAGVGYWQHQDGVTVTTEKYERRDNLALSKANNRITELEQQYRAEEQAHAVRMSSIADTYEKELKNANDKTTALIAAARTGTFRLRDPQAARLPTLGSHPAQTAAGPGRSDGQAGAELSGTTVEFLISLTGEADDITRQLGACQAVVRSDRDTVDP
jgi:prophage endopeptidase